MLGRSLIISVQIFDGKEKLFPKIPGFFKFGSHFVVLRTQTDLYSVFICDVIGLFRAVFDSANYNNCPLAGTSDCAIGASFAHSSEQVPFTSEFVGRISLPTEVEKVSLCRKSWVFFGCPVYSPMESRPGGRG